MSIDKQSGARKNPPSRLLPAETGASKPLQFAVLAYYC